MSKDNSRRDFLRGAAGITAALSSAGIPLTTAAEGGPSGASLAGKPNILFIMTDEERFPPGYETAAIKQWRKTQLPGREMLKQNALEMRRHYTAATACVPARTTLFTGHYPSMHGASQTDGAAKSPNEDDMFWLDASTVPTLGNYFEAAGYRTFYKGKWHVSEADISVPGTKTALNTYLDDGSRDGDKEQAYLNANRLADYGFSGYVGPTPHGQDPRNSGSSSKTGTGGRDVVFADWMVELLDNLERDPSTPWLAVCSFVNPHDIVLYGALSSRTDTFDFTIDAGIPAIPRSPTDGENLRTKPTAQASYKRTYQDAFQPTFNRAQYRQLYYQLQKDVDAQILRVMERLKASPFYENTIVVFTSDHGEMLGSHGGLYQKWHVAYEEAIRVPMYIHNPVLFPTPRKTREITSHIDMVPTLLGLAGLDAETLRTALSKTHTDALPLVGRNLKPLVEGEAVWPGKDEGIYFMTDDEPTSGSNQNNFSGFAYNSVIQPSHVETVVSRLTIGGQTKVWKYSRYFDNPQFWTQPCTKDVIYPEIGFPNLADCQPVQRERTSPVADQFELYDLTTDPYEATNLAFPGNATTESGTAISLMAGILAQQRQQKRLLSATGQEQGVTYCTT